MDIYSTTSFPNNSEEPKYSVVIRSNTVSYIVKSNEFRHFPPEILSNLNGSNTFGTMEICSRHR